MKVRIGKVMHYYRRIQVAVVCLDEAVQVGDSLLFLGHTTDFIQELTSMEAHHEKILSAGCGAAIAIRVNKPVREGDAVFRVSQEERLAYAESGASPGG